MIPSYAVQQRREREFEQARSEAEVAELQRRWGAEDRAVAEAESSQAQALKAAQERITALEQRLAAIERRTGSGGALINAIGDAIGRLVGERTTAAIKPLADRLDDLESTRLRFQGVHEVGRFYEPGSLVVRSGSLWHCNSETRDQPGSSRAWQMCVKHGEAAKKAGIA